MNVIRSQCEVTLIRSCCEVNVTRSAPSHLLHPRQAADSLSDLLSPRSTYTHTLTTIESPSARVSQLLSISPSEPHHATLQHHLRAYFPPPQLRKSVFELIGFHRQVAYSLSCLSRM